jgi:hypothetical protein
LGSYRAASERKVRRGRWWTFTATGTEILGEDAEGYGSFDRFAPSHNAELLIDIVGVLGHRLPREE